MIKKATEKYNIIVMSKGSSSIRKFEISRRFLGFALAFAFCLSALLVASFAGLYHYRSAYLATESVRLEAADYKRESSQLLSKLASLEDTIGRTVRFATRVESIINRDSRIEPGEGPIEEENWVPVLTESQQAGQSTRKAWGSPFAKVYSADLNFKIDELMAMASVGEEKVNAVFALQQDRLFFWSSIPSIWPTRGWVTSDFGDRRTLRVRTGGRRSYSSRWHDGIDIAAPIGTPIISAGDGFVTFAGYRSGYGKTIIVDHGNGISTIYAHCSAVFVDEGKKVSRGMIIAAVGSTGRSTGAHLHYEVRVDDVPVNPMEYLVSNM